MEGHQKDMSMLFYEYLCDVIGTKEVVETRRHVLHAADSILSLQPGPIISSGSKAEGLDLNGSDVDMMIVIDTHVVHEHASHVNDKSEKIQLLMETDATKPGFTKLKVVGDDTSIIGKTCSMSLENKTYISSALIRRFYIENSPSIMDRIHGPCVSISDKVDFAFCFQCTKWISQAYDFIFRTKYSWISNRFLEIILQFGVLFVPIGSKHSLNNDLEWRISFSFPEKLLIWSFNHVQLLCYALLKILLKEVIKKMMPDTHADLLCSYFLKTIMFWLCEETEATQWKSDKMLPCFWIAFKRLIYCVENKTCLHYFIPEINLFENQFSDDQHKTLLLTLKHLWNIGWPCLLVTETLQSFKDIYTPSLSSDIRIATFIPFLCMTNTFVFIDNSVDDIYYYVYNCIRSLKKFFFIYQISYINHFIAQDIALDNLRSNNNKKKYKQYRKVMCHLLVGVNHDAMSGWLLLASFFETNKQYLKCKHLIDFCLSPWLQEQRLATPLARDTTYQRLFNDIRGKLPTSDHGDFLACKYFTVMPITCIESKCIVPGDVPLPVRPKEVSPVVFAYYLRFLCNRLKLDPLGNLRRRDELINALKNTNPLFNGDLDCLTNAQFYFLKSIELFIKFMDFACN